TFTPLALISLASPPNEPLSVKPRSLSFVSSLIGERLSGCKMLRTNCLAEFETAATSSSAAVRGALAPPDLPVCSFSPAGPGAHPASFFFFFFGARFADVFEPLAISPSLVCSAHNLFPGPIPPRNATQECGGSDCKSRAVGRNGARVALEPQGGRQQMCAGLP